MQNKNLSIYLMVKFANFVKYLIYVTYFTGYINILLVISNFKNHGKIFWIIRMIHI